MTKEKKNLLVFGYGLAVIITVFVLRHGMKGEFTVFSWMWLALAAGLAVITAIDHRLIKPFYTKWMVVAHFIGTIVTTVILSVLFFVLFGITGIVLRILRKDLLDRKLEPGRNSYWIKREGKFEKESYLKQF